MRTHIRFVMNIALFVILVFPISSRGEGPKDQIQHTTAVIIAILTSPDLATPEKALERRRLVREAVDERFDWIAISRRALGRHWRKMSDAEKGAFVPLFRNLLERTYLQRMEEYSRERIEYESESLDGDYAVVNVNIMSDRFGTVPVKYRVKKKGNDWRVYDISIEGVSLVSNYRSQFNKILMKSTLGDLIERIKEKLKQ